MEDAATHDTATAQPQVRNVGVLESMSSASCLRPLGPCCVSRRCKRQADDSGDISCQSVDRRVTE